MGLSIKKLGPALAGDFLYFFDELAFADNPDWAGCYCFFFHVPDDEEWMGRTAERNREEAEKAIAAGNMRGYLAYMDGGPVGWCHADDLARLPRAAKLHEGEMLEAGKIGAIVCFIIARPYRRRGIAGELLRRVCQDFKDDGYECLEAYPRKEAETDAANYHGPMRMYLGNGFAFHKECEGYCVVRRNL